MYREICEPLLTSATPPRVGFAYHIYERATNKDVMFSGLAPADALIQKGNPVIPAGLVVKVKDLAPGSYRLVVQAGGNAHKQSPDTTIQFHHTDLHTGVKNGNFRFFVGNVTV